LTARYFGAFRFLPVAHIRSALHLFNQLTLESGTSENQPPALAHQPTLRHPRLQV